jgi:hypothetical protein
VCTDMQVWKYDSRTLLCYMHASVEAQQHQPRGSRGFAPASWRLDAIGMGCKLVFSDNSMTQYDITLEAKPGSVNIDRDCVGLSTVHSRLTRS